MFWWSIYISFLFPQQNSLFDEKIQPINIFHWKCWFLQSDYKTTISFKTKYIWKQNPYYNRDFKNKIRMWWRGNQLFIFFRWPKLRGLWPWSKIYRYILFFLQLDRKNHSFFFSFMNHDHIFFVLIYEAIENEFIIILIRMALKLDENSATFFWVCGRSIDGIYLLNESWWCHGAERIRLRCVGVWTHSALCSFRKTNF